MTDQIKNFFYPKSICVVGASTKEKSIGYELLKTIKVYDYKGEVFPVNPKADEVLGYRCYKSIDEIERTIDLAILVVPKPFVDDSVNRLLSKGVKSIVLVTAGFKEVGEEGAKAENLLLEKIRLAGARMVGPNCMGVISTLDDIKLNATFVAEKPEIGKIGFLSQSGALGAAVLNSLRETDIRFAHFISVGNKADINENDILEFWQEDENINSLTFYLESFVNGEAFIKSFITGKVNKPSIVLKAGKTSGGMKAASSHTGALGSSDGVVDALLKQFGIIRVDDLNEMFNTAKGFDNFPITKGNRIGVVTNAGGPAILAVDAIENAGLKLADLSEDTKQKLREIVHPEGSVNNPVDTLPGGNAETYKKVNELLIADENVDAVVSIFVEPVMVKPMPLIEGIAGINSGKPIMQVVMPLPEFWQKYREESEKKLPLFRNPEDPAKVISNMLFYSNSQKELADSREEYLGLLSLDRRKNNFESGFINQAEVQKVTEKYDLPIVKSLTIKPDELNKITDDYFPLVIKGVNKEVIHKSELNAVKLNIKNREELKIAVKEIIDSFKNNNFEIEEFLIQQFIKTKHEVLLGGFRDPSFGPVLMFGTGGKYVETIGDISMKSAYISDSDIEKMISETKMGKILSGVRGEKPVNMSELKRIIKLTAKMFIENREITEFDFNPLIVSTDDKIYAVDIRIKIE
ncbi:MAG: acetate--CoA ligase family protein [Melioribacteraceae bacterium]|nr:acetate--CoA ligase family protein [Melioribacteraceae bacterium]